ncbi:MAG: Spy/CpxP family protein refolding chaperone [Desulfobacterales bacterium]|nr:Spy/CpxP family protein refolding chaperone [Desulfobacterales bacterium]
MNGNFSKKFAATLIVFLIAAWVSPAIAGAFSPCEGKRDKGFGKGRHQPCLGIWRNPQMIQKLKLTEEQVKQLKDVDFTFREKRLELQAQLDGFYLQMDKAFSDDRLDDAAVLKLAQNISDIRGKMFIQNIESHLTIYKLLNTDQIKNLKLHDIDRKKQRLKDGKKKISGPHGMQRPFDKKPFENCNE